MDKYTKKQIEKMRLALCEDEHQCIEDKTVYEILLEGCVGWNNMKEEEVIEKFKDQFDKQDQDFIIR